jgi:hypothetical protein
MESYCSNVSAHSRTSFHVATASVEAVVALRLGSYVVQFIGFGSKLGLRHQRLGLEPHRDTEQGHRPRPI